jgi:hypothetical protein
MKRKKILKKICRYEISFCIAITLICFTYVIPVSSLREIEINKPITVENCIETISPFGMVNCPNPTLFINLFVEIPIIVNIPFVLNIVITGGVPPFNVTIDWGDGDFTNISKTEETNLSIPHIYSSIGDYTIKCYVNDSVGDSDRCKLVVEVIERVCDLGISISTEKPYYCEGETIELNIKVWSVQNSIITDCPGYKIIVNVSPCNEKHVRFGDTISPGEIRDHPLPCCFGCLGPIFVDVIVVPECLDTNWANNFNKCTFCIFPEWVCDILDNLPEVIIEFLFGNQ